MFLNWFNSDEPYFSPPHSRLLTKWEATQKYVGRTQYDSVHNVWMGEGAIVSVVIQQDKRGSLRRVSQVNRQVMPRGKKYLKQKEKNSLH